MLGICRGLLWFTCSTKIPHLALKLYLNLLINVTYFPLRRKVVTIKYVFSNLWEELLSFTQRKMSTISRPPCTAPYANYTQPHFVCERCPGIRPSVRHFGLRRSSENRKLRTEGRPLRAGLQTNRLGQA